MISGGAIQMRLTGEALTFFTEAAKHFPKQVRAAHGQAASAVRNRMRKVMRVGGGIHGTAPFAPHAQLTRFLRGARTMGGKLADPNVIVNFLTAKDTQVIGWLSALDGHAMAFQSASQRPFTSEERRMFYRRGIKGKEEEYAGVKFNKMQGELARLREGYNRPARNMVDPVVLDALPELPRWIHGAFQKALLRGKLAGAGRSA